MWGCRGLWGWVPRGQVGKEVLSGIYHSPSCSSVSVGPRGLAGQLSRHIWPPFPPQDLLKHTPEDHPDHPLLLDAQRNIKQVAERINKGVRSAEEAERHARVLQEIEAHIEGMEDVRAALPLPAHACVHLWSPGLVAMSTLAWPIEWGQGVSKVWAGDGG